MKGSKDRDPLRTSSIWRFIQRPTFNNNIYDSNKHLSLITYPKLINPKYQLSYFILGYSLYIYFYVCVFYVCSRMCVYVGVHVESHERLSDVILSHFPPYSIIRGSHWAWSVLWVRPAGRRAPESSSLCYSRLELSEGTRPSSYVGRSLRGKLRPSHLCSSIVSKLGLFVCLGRPQPPKRWNYSPMSPSLSCFYIFNVKSCKKYFS